MKGAVRKKKDRLSSNKVWAITKICFHFEWKWEPRQRVLFKSDIYLLASIFTFPIINREKCVEIFLYNSQFVYFPYSLISFALYVLLGEYKLRSVIFLWWIQHLKNYYLELFLIKRFCILNLFCLRIIYSYSSFSWLLFSRYSSSSPILFQLFLTYGYIS